MARTNRSKKVKVAESVMDIAEGIADESPTLNDLQEPTDEDLVAALAEQPADDALYLDMAEQVESAADRYDPLAGIGQPFDDGESEPAARVVVADDRAAEIAAEVGVTVEQVQEIAAFDAAASQTPSVEPAKLTTEAWFFNATADVVKGMVAAGTITGLLADAVNRSEALGAWTKVTVTADDVASLMQAATAALPIFEAAVTGADGKDAKVQARKHLKGFQGFIGWLERAPAVLAKKQATLDKQDAKKAARKGAAAA